MLRRSRHHAALLAGIALCMCALAANAGAADVHAGPWPQARQGFLIGFGLGGGSAAATYNNATDAANPLITTERVGGGTGSFRFGYAFSPQLTLEYDSSAWVKNEPEGSVSFDDDEVAVNYYPGGQGFMLRGGVGYGTVSLPSTYSGLSGNFTPAVHESGFSAIGALGYEFRVRRTFALGPTINYNHISTDTFQVDWVDGELAFTWYFLPKP